MKTPCIALFFFLGCHLLAAQKYLYDNVFTTSSLELNSNEYTFTESFCTGGYFSKGNYHINGDTLFLTSSPLNNDRKDSIMTDSTNTITHYMDHFVHMVNEPFRIKDQHIYPIDLDKWGYLSLEKVD
jgi:hypothetical protein